MTNFDTHDTRVAEFLADVYDREAALMPSNPLFEESKALLKERARQYRRNASPATVPAARFDMSPESLWGDDHGKIAP
jgi:hypothetical protein